MADLPATTAGAARPPGRRTVRVVMTAGIAVAVAGGVASAVLPTPAGAPAAAVGLVTAAGTATPATTPPEATATTTAASTPATTAAATAGDAAPGSPVLESITLPLLTERSAAVLTGRRERWAAGLAPAARAEQLTEFDRIRLLPVRRWEYTLLSVSAAHDGEAHDGEAHDGEAHDGEAEGGTRLDDPAPDGTLTARVRLAYRLAGDTRDVEREQELTLVRHGPVWALGAVRRLDAAADPWELGPLTVVTGRRGVVVGVGDRPGGVPVQRIAGEVDAAAAMVDDVWGAGLRGPVVVLVPATRQSAAALLGRDTGAALDQVAAVTDGELVRGGPEAGAGQLPPGTADRVVVSPEPFARLSPLGRRVVLAHELTHVTTRAAVRVTLPLWVDEGFAAYVAYRGSGLGAGVLAADVLPAVRAGTARDHLPATADFDPAHGDIAPAYADAWLAFDLMARQGADRPLAFYRAAAAGEGGTLAGAFAGVLHTDEQGFEARWLAYRAALATGRATTRAR